MTKLAQDAPVEYSAIRIPKRRGYTVVPNGVLPEGKISARAWGLYVYLLSRPPGWEVRTSQLQNIFTEGRDAIRSSMTQLVKAGLMTIETYRNEQGLPRKRYVMIDPETIKHSPNTGFQGTGNPATEKPSVTTTDLTSPDLSHASKESSTSDKSDTLARPSGASTRSVGGLNEKQRKLLRGKLMAVGQLLKDGHKFHDDVAQDAWQDFAYALEDTLGDAYADGYADLVDNGKWTVSAKVASPYGAGAELNKLINTAAQ